MSYSTYIKLNKKSNIKNLTHLIRMLGYKKIKGSYKIRNCIGSYFRFEDHDFKSSTGVELYIFRYKLYISVSTCSRISRSYWDLDHQNKTIKLIRDFFGGNLETDYRKNRFLNPENVAPKLISSACYLAHWNFMNNMKRLEFYLSQRGLDAKYSDMAKSPHFTRINPLILSNNMTVPYVISIWEEFIRNIFLAILVCRPTKKLDSIKINLNKYKFDKIILKNQLIEEVISEDITFQKPS